MIDCLIIGDSIASGVAIVTPKCTSYSRPGISSANWNRTYLLSASNKPAKVVIISLGANDQNPINTVQELRTLRARIKGDKVFWIDTGLNRKPLAKQAIAAVAQEYGDEVIDRPLNHMGRDGVHPTFTGYREISKQALKGLNSQ